MPCSAFHHAGELQQQSSFEQPLQEISSLFEEDDDDDFTTLSRNEKNNATATSKQVVQQFWPEYMLK